MALEFAAQTASIATARNWVVRQAAIAGVSATHSPIIKLLSSELITNALLHGPPLGLVTVRVLRQAGTLRVEVDDESTMPPQIQDPDRSTIGGRGLILVDTHAARWGCDLRGANGKTVWFSLDV